MAKMKKRLVLRAAEPADEPFLFHLQKLATVRYLDRPGNQNGTAEVYSREQLELRGLMIIENDIERIGLFKFDGTDTRWFIEQIQLLPDHQGKRIGEHVIRAFLDQAKQADAQVWLNVSRNNLALRLYNRLGFRVASTNELEVTMIWHPRL